MGIIGNKLKSIAFNLFKGLHNADTTAFGSNVTNGDEFNNGIEIQDEQNSVYQDLVNHRVTQAVKELRYNMYLVSEESKKYDYTGNGTAKKNNVFNKNWNVENSDNDELILLQKRHTPDRLSNQFNGVVIGEDTKIVKEDFDETFVIERDYTPRFNIEKFITKIVLKKNSVNEYILDLYVPIYDSQFDNIKRIFTNEMNRLNNGDRRSELVDFTDISFITNGAYGFPDFRLFKFKINEYVKTLTYNGSFVIRFVVDDICYNLDLTDEFYDKIADEKNKSKSKREGYKEKTISFNDAIELNKSENFDIEQAIELLNEE